MFDHNGRTPLLFRNLAIDGPIRKVTRVPWVSEPQSLPGRETKPNAPSPFSSPGVKRMIGPPKNGAHKKLVEYDSGRPFVACAHRVRRIPTIPSNAAGMCQACGPYGRCTGGNSTRCSEVDVLHPNGGSERWTSLVKGEH